MNSTTIALNSRFLATATTTATTTTTRLVKPRMLSTLIRHYSIRKNSKTLSNGLMATELTNKVTRLDLANASTNSNRKTFRGPLKCAVLDWSGTTVDPHVMAPAMAFVEVFKKNGVSLSMEEARGPMGLRKDLHIAKVLELPEVKKRWTKVKGSPPTEETVQQLFNDFIPMQEEVLVKHSPVLPGVAKITERMKSHYNMKIGVTTGFTKSMVDIVLRESKKQGFVPDSTVAGDEVGNDLGYRPTPFMLYQNLYNLGIYPIESVIKVDDTVTGVIEGLNAGCWSIGVYGWSNYNNINTIEQWENMSTEEQKKCRLKAKEKLMNESQAHYIIEELSDLDVVIPDINERLKRGEAP